MELFNTHMEDPAGIIAPTLEPSYINSYAEDMEKHGDDQCCLFVNLNDFFRNIQVQTPNGNEIHYLLTIPVGDDKYNFCTVSIMEVLPMLSLEYCKPDHAFRIYFHYKMYRSRQDIFPPPKFDQWDELHATLRPHSNKVDFVLDIHIKKQPSPPTISPNVEEISISIPYSPNTP